jgi:hypothetical protein
MPKDQTGFRRKGGKDVIMDQGSVQVVYHRVVPEAKTRKDPKRKSRSALSQEFVIDESSEEEPTAANNTAVTCVTTQNNKVPENSTLPESSLNATLPSLDQIHSSAHVVESSSAHAVESSSAHVVESQLTANQPRLHKESALECNSFQLENEEYGLNSS